jgi:cbb3-type cytochrome oxidase subunit 3
MRPLGGTLISVIALSLFMPLHLRAQEPSEASLVAAWEQSLRSDPYTEILEKKGEGSYRFKSKRFPFDGELQVLGVAVGDPLAEGWYGDVTPGTVEVQLAGVADDFPRKYAASYAQWESGNTLYWDGKTKTWITAREWRRRVMRKAGRWSFLSFASSTFWILFLLVLVGILLWISRKAGRQMKTAMKAQERLMADHERVLKLSERGVELSEDSNRVLKEILQELKGGGGRGAGSAGEKSDPKSEG